MEKITQKLFGDYLSETNVAALPEYATLAKAALGQEKQLRDQLDETQTKCFEELLELTSQIHFLEVKDAFFYACKLGAGLSKELT